MAAEGLGAAFTHKIFSKSYYYDKKLTITRWEIPRIKSLFSPCI